MNIALIGVSVFVGTNLLNQLYEQEEIRLLNIDNNPFEKRNSFTKKESVKKKSMSYLGNIVFFIKLLIANKRKGIVVFNDMPKTDFSINCRYLHQGKALGRHLLSLTF